MNMLKLGRNTDAECSSMVDESLCVDFYRIRAIFFADFYIRDNKI
jgi:hypothetical protein